MKKQLTLCIPIEEGKVLLGMKKRGFGQGRWNGFGGKVEANETIEGATKRELQEEVGVKDGVLTKVGTLEFSFEDREDTLEVHVFKLTAFEDNPVETEEMKPQWFLYDEIPFKDMWADDELWLPFLLDDKLFKGEFLFDRPADKEYSGKILEYKLDEVSVLT